MQVARAPTADGPALVNSYLLVQPPTSQSRGLREAIPSSPIGGAALIWDPAHQLKTMYLSQMSTVHTIIVRSVAGTP